VNQSRADASLLFQPFRLKSLALKNRLVMAPMTRSFSPGGIPPPDVAAYYRRRAEGRVGLIITEGTGIDRPASRNDPDVPEFHGAALASWQRVADEVHGAGGAIAPQLWHVGSSRNRLKPDYEPPGPPESPSGCNARGEPVGIAMTEDDIAAAIGAYAAGAAAARRLGFDAVELHGAHGYLIDQFFRAETNLRTDDWGGATLRRRARFGVEVVRACRAALGPDIPLILRLSQFRLDAYDVKVAWSPEEMRTWLEPLAAAGVDAFHCSQRRFWEPEFEGSDLNFAGWAKKLTGTPSITVGSVGLSGEFVGALRAGEPSTPTSLDALLQRLEREEFDLVAVGRTLLADPGWAIKIAEGRDDELTGYNAEAKTTLY
jgi:2,4-dienoyl-CoA reductase-like NADH-dependent reductase (Old Yellow Enzyme family)